jgi:DNA-binding SARP family transcriptional activator/WD40 repeat protein
MPHAEFRVLGPLEVVREGHRLDLGGERRRALLALLLLRPNQVVPSEWIVDELFRDAAADPANALQVAISRLRRSLGDGVLETRPRGYLVNVDPEQLDSLRFERLSEEGRALAASGESERAGAAFAEALGLWRGPPLQEVGLFDFAQSEIRRLEELRLAVRMDRFDAELALGRSGELVPELEALARENPLQERLQGQWMLALYRAGRQADALEVYNALQTRLREELGLEPSRALQRLQRAILNHEDDLQAVRATVVEPVSVVCPFKGLAPYDRDDAEFFFGRERQVAAVIGRLAASPFVGVVGASGSGKSSIVQAGVVPALENGALPGSTGWPLQRVRVGDGLDPAAGLIVVDPLEEAFVASDAERAQFFDALVDATERSRVIVCLRADFYGRCAEHQGLADMLSESQVLVGPMAPDELRWAIEAPTATAGLVAEPGLVDALLADVKGEPGALPLLSATLLELWQLRGGDVLRLETYRAAGGVDGAVARLAEQTYGRLTAPERELARETFMRLSDEGPDSPVRRRVPLAQLPDRDVTEKLASARLIIVSDGFVEIAHEALLRHWPRLRDWLEADATGRRVQRELAGQAERWEAGRRGNADLYRGARLAAALEWAATETSHPTANEAAFLAASQRSAQRTLRRLRAVVAGLSLLLLLVVAGGVVAFLQRQAARREARVALAARLGAQAVAEPRLDRALLLAREAVRLDDTADTREALLVTLLRSPALTGSLVLPAGTRPYRVTVAPDGRTLGVGDSDGALRLFDTSTDAQIGAPQRKVYGFLPAAYTPDGSKLVAVASPPNALEVLDPKTLAPLRSLRLDPRFNPDKAGAVAPLAVTADAALFAYDLVTDPQGDEGPAFLDRLDLVTGDLRSVRLGSPDVVGSGLVHGRLVTVTSRLIETWDTRTLRRVGAVRVPIRLGGYAAVDPTGRYVVGLAHFANAIVFVDLRNGRVISATGPGSTGGALAVAFSPDGGTAATAGSDGTITLWNPSIGAEIATLPGHSAAANGVAFSPDGKTLYGSSLDGTVLAWSLDPTRRFGVSLAVPAQPAPVPNVPEVPPLAVTLTAAVVRSGHGLESCALPHLRACTALPASSGPLVTTVATGDGLLAAGRVNGEVELWSGVGSPRALTGLTTSVQSLSFSSSGTLLAGVGLRILAVWSTATGATTLRKALPENATAVAFAPDGKEVAVGLADGHIRVQSIGGKATRTLDTHGAPNVSLAFLPDGTLLSGSFDGTLERWNVRTGRMLAQTLSSTGPVAAIAVDPGDAVVLTSSLTGGTLHEWSLPGLQPLANLPGDPFVPTAVGLTSGGRAALAVFGDGRGIAWPLDPSEWAARACRAAGRQLTAAEWRQFLPGRRPAAVCP